jgi:hypothetical protein
MVVADSLYIRCGIGGWRFMSKHPCCGDVVYPADGTPPDAYTWPVKGLWCYVLPYGVDVGLVADLALHLLRCGAERVQVLDSRFTTDGSKCATYTAAELPRGR